MTREAGGWVVGGFGLWVVVGWKELARQQEEKLQQNDKSSEKKSSPWS